MAIYGGSCHCGRVRFEIKSDLAELTTCDCSLCRKKNALMVKVHEDDFKLVAGEDSLGLYQWNMKIARHHFCRHCGIYTFHRKRSEPDCYGINAYCLDNADISDVPIRHTNGKSMSLAGE